MYLFLPAASGVSRFKMLKENYNEERTVAPGCSVPSLLLAGASAFWQLREIMFLLV